MQDWLQAYLGDRRSEVTKELGCREMTPDALLRLNVELMVLSDMEMLLDNEICDIKTRIGG